MDRNSSPGPRRCTRAAAGGHRRRVAIGGLFRLWKSLGLALFTLGVFGDVLVSSAPIRRDDLLGPWWQIG